MFVNHRQGALVVCQQGFDTRMNPGNIPFEHFEAVYQEEISLLRRMALQGGKACNRRFIGCIAPNAPYRIRRITNHPTLPEQANNV